MNIAFVSTRLAGTDGVSLETRKLAIVLERDGHNIFYCAGELDGTYPQQLIPEMHFTDPTAVALGERAFGGTEPDPTLLADIGERAAELKRPLHTFITQYKIDFLIIQNAFAIPMQLPLAQALAELLAETGLPALAHNHDLYWERDRFAANRIPDFLDTYFPPDLPNLRHATINSLAQAALKQRRGIDSIILPNVFDFATPPPAIDSYSADFRQAIGLTPDDWLILQPTRVIPRKGIELSIELLAQLNDPRAKLVITHNAGDEGMAYLQQLQALAQAKQVDLRYVADQVDELRGTDSNGRKRYALWDTYPHADFVAYPSIIEGFGNALIETIYFCLPVLVNRYIVYAKDIGPKGFDFVEINAAATNNPITPATVARVRHLLTHPAEVQAIVAHNYQLGQTFYSYETLATLLRPLLPV